VYLFASSACNMLLSRMTQIVTAVPIRSAAVSVPDNVQSCGVFRHRCLSVHRREEIQMIWKVYSLGKLQTPLIRLSQHSCRVKGYREADSATLGNEREERATSVVYPPAKRARLSQRNYLGEAVEPVSPKMDECLVRRRQAGHLHQSEQGYNCSQ